MNLKVFAKTVEREVYDQLKQLMSVDVFKDTIDIVEVIKPIYNFKSSY